MSMQVRETVCINLPRFEAYCYWQLALVSGEGPILLFQLLHFIFMGVPSLWNGLHLHLVI